MDVMATLGKIGFDLPVFIYNLINFSILAFLLQKFFFKKTVATMEERQRLIAEGLEKTETAVHTVEVAELKKAEIIKDAKNEADVIVESAAKKANETSRELSEKARVEVLSMKEKAKRDLAEEKNRMVKNFKEEAVTIVLDTASKVAKSGETSIGNVKTALTA